MTPTESATESDTELANTESADTELAILNRPPPCLVEVLRRSRRCLSDLLISVIFGFLKELGFLTERKTAGGDFRGSDTQMVEFFKSDRI